MTGSRIATTNGATREDVLAEVEPSNVNSVLSIQPMSFVPLLTIQSRGPLNGNQSEQPQASAPKSVTFPQALPRMGKFLTTNDRVRPVVLFMETLIDARSRPSYAESYDVVVLRWLLYRSVRRPTAPSEHGDYE